MTAVINIQSSGGGVFEVTVAATRTTQHIVTVADDYATRLTGGKVSVELLVRRSFEFLLEREPNTSILSRFELPVISRYFPEYERTIGAMLGE